MNLFTIGHSDHTIEAFCGLLLQNAIDCLLDVRSVPYSRYASQFNEDSLGPHLSGLGIRYFPAGKPFGARRTDLSLYNSEGYLDFDLVRSTELFSTAVEHVIKRLRDGESVALMCTEKHPIDCHRAIMVARGFELKGVAAQHILYDGCLLSQDELNVQLLDMYHPNRSQMSFFADTEEEELLLDSYRKQNEKIGYRASDLGKG